MRNSIFTKHNAGTCIKHMYTKFFDWVYGLGEIPPPIEKDITHIAKLLGQIRTLELGEQNKEKIVSLLEECISIIKYVESALTSNTHNIKDLLSTVIKRIK